MIFLWSFLIWYFFYVPIHNRMPWSYNKWLERKVIKIKTRRRDWE